MIKLLLDQGIPYSTISHLQETGWDIVHVRDLGMSRASDQEILQYARNNEYICITLDVDFHTLLILDQAIAPSVIRIRQQGLKGMDIAALLRKLWLLISEQLKRKALVSVTEKNVRIHYLPIMRNENSK